MVKNEGSRVMLTQMETNTWSDMNADPLTRESMDSINTQGLTNYFEEVIKWLKVHALNKEADITLSHANLPP